MWKLKFSCCKLHYSSRILTESILILSVYKNTALMGSEFPALTEI